MALLNLDGFRRIMATIGSSIVLLCIVVLVNGVNAGCLASLEKGELVRVGEAMVLEPGPQETKNFSATYSV